MKEATQRLIVRWIHIVCSIPIIGYICSPFEHLPDYAPPTRFVFFPVMLLSGLWMWKDHLVRRLVSKRSEKISLSINNRWASAESDRGHEEDDGQCEGREK